jgi:hypothetical protein
MIFNIQKMMLFIFYLTAYFFKFFYITVGFLTNRKTNFYRPRIKVDRIKNTIRPSEMKDE